LGLGGSVVFLFAGVIAVSSHSTVTDAPNWTRALSDLIVAPAHAERDDRRSRRKGSGDDRQADAAVKRAQQSVQQAEAAGKRLQEAAAAQKRIQQMQETAAAAQKRMQQLQETVAAQKRIQDLQRVEASQKQIQQIQRPDVSPRRLQQLEASRQQHRHQPAASPPPSNVQPVTPRQTVADRHRVALEETMAKLRGHRNAPRQETFRPETPRQTASSRHQAVIDQMTAKLRGRQQAPRQHADVERPSAGHRHQAVLTQVMAKLRGHSQASRNAPRYDDRSSRDGFGGHGRQPALQSVMDRLRARHSDRSNDRFDRGRSGQGHHESRQHAIYSHILTKFSRHGRKSREEPKVAAVAPAPPAPTPPPATPPPATKQQTAASSPPSTPQAASPPPSTPPQPQQKKKPKSTGSELLPGAPDLTTVATTIGSRLPEVASRGDGKATSESDRTMSRLGGPEQPSSDERSSGDERRAGRSRTQKKDDDADGDGSPPVKSTGRDLGRRVAGSLLPPPGSFRPNEVLAVNLSAAGLARALQRNFKVLEKVEYPALGFNLTRLATPDTQNAIIGRSTLHEELPADGFGLNHIYAAGRVTATVPSGTVLPNSPDGGAGKAPAAPSNPSPSPGGNWDRRAGTCAQDRCFGVSVINWQPQLAACAKGIKIGIIDTGVDKNHPAFAGVHFKHEDFVPSNSKKPSNHHGTGVFSLLAGNPRSSTPGLVPDATFLFGDAFFADRNGNAMSDTITMLKALNWLKGAGVDIANLSFAGPPDELVHDAIRELAKTGTVILAAAGNEGQDAPPSYPAAYKEVIAVTAIDRNLAPYAYANRGSHIDVAAPGVDVWTALPNRREGLQTGTSFAVPFVTSVVALSYRPEERTAHTDPLAPKRQALAQLQKNIKVIGGRGQAPIFGAGLVQAPSHCDPRGPAIIAKADRWNGTVQAAPPANAPNVQAGSWTSTVHPVASRK